jgi:hypothetical protein
MKKILVFLVTLMLALPVVAKDHKGKGAGGARDEHVSEMGMEKGKALAGTNEKKAKEEEEESSEDGMKEKKEKKAKKEKKSK